MRRKERELEKKIAKLEHKIFNQKCGLRDLRNELGYDDDFTPTDFVSVYKKIDLLLKHLGLKIIVIEEHAEVVKTPPDKKEKT